MSVYLTSTNIQRSSNASPKLEINNGHSRTSPVAQPNSSSTGKIIARLKEKIQQLENENKELKRKNEALAGQVYRVHYLQEQVERQQQIIEDLQGKSKGEQLDSKVTPISSKRKSYD